MNDFFNFDPKAAGSKGLVFIGEKILVYRRDDKTDIHPLEIDVPGGGPKPNETPYETFKREVKEEFDLDVTQQDIVYVRKYPSVLEPGKNAYFPVAILDNKYKLKIRLGDEGVEYMLMTLDDYFSLDDAWAIFQDRARDYKNSLRSSTKG